MLLVVLVLEGRNLKLGEEDLGLMAGGEVVHFLAPLACIHSFMCDWRRCTWLAPSGLVVCVALMIRKGWTMATKAVEKCTALFNSWTSLATNWKIARKR